MTEPHDVSDLPAYFGELADMYNRDRFGAICAGDMTNAHYYQGKVDAFRGAAGAVQHLLGSFDPNGDSPDPRDEEAAAIERLDGHKHAGDPWVLQSAR